MLNSERWNSCVLNRASQVLTIHSYEVLLLFNQICVWPYGQIKPQPSGQTHRNIQLNWLIGPRILISGFPLPADVNRALCGGGVPEDRTHAVPKTISFKKIIIGRHHNVFLLD